MGKLALVIMFISLVAFTPIVQSNAEDQEEIGKWFQKVSYAKEKMTKFHFYWHDTLTGKNPTAMKVAQSNITGQSPTFFGLINMMDDPLTVGPEPTSKLIGRAQGLYGSAGQQALGLLMAMNMLFTTGKYNGSTLTILGRNAAPTPIREMPIVGGSGVFRLARGLALAKTYSFNTTTRDAIVEYNVFITHY